MGNYSDIERRTDFDYFIENYKKLYETYGHKFLASELPIV